MSIVLNNNNAYSPDQPIAPMPPMPIPAQADPTANNFAPAGTVWLNTLTPSAFINAGTVNGQAQWITVGGLSGTFTNLTVTNTATIGNGLTVSAGGATITGNSTITGSLTTTTDITGRTLFASGDQGTGVNNQTAITSATNTTQGAGNLSILSTNGNAGDNAGFIKIYVGTDEAYIPYFTNIAP